MPGGQEVSTTAGVNDERLRAFSEWIGSHAGRSTPPLSDEAVSRESVYREREDRQL